MKFGLFLQVFATTRMKLTHSSFTLGHSFWKIYEPDNLFSSTLCSSQMYYMIYRDNGKFKTGIGSYNGLGKAFLDSFISIARLFALHKMGIRIG